MSTEKNTPGNTLSTAGLEKIDSNLIKANLDRNTVRDIVANSGINKNNAMANANPLTANIPTVEREKSGVNIASLNAQLNRIQGTGEPSTFVKVTGVSLNIPSSIIAGTSHQLIATVTPSNATNQHVSYGMTMGGTGATLSGSTLTVRTPGTLALRATVTNGLAQGSHFTREYSITVRANPAQREGDIRTGLRNISFSSAAIRNTEIFNESPPEKFVPQGSLGILKWETDVNVPARRQSCQPHVQRNLSHNIYPGALLLVDPGIATAEPTPFAAPSRGVLTLKEPNRAHIAIQRDVPITSANVALAVSRMKQSLLNTEGVRQPSTLNVNMRTFTSIKELAMSFGVKASFLGAQAGLKADIEKKSSEFIVSVSSKQDYFTVSIDTAWQQNPALLFGPNTTWESLRPLINGRSIAIVTSVTYGRYFSYLRSFKSNSFSFKSDQLVSAFGQNWSSNQNFKKAITSSETGIYDTGGGSALSAKTLNSMGNEDAITNAIARNLNFTSIDQGLPVCYTIALITGGDVGRPIEPEVDVRFFRQAYKFYPRSIQIQKRRHRDFSSVHRAATKVILDCSFFQITGGRQVSANSGKRRNGKALKIVEASIAPPGLEQYYTRQPKHIFEI